MVVLSSLTGLLFLFSAPGDYSCAEEGLGSDGPDTSDSSGITASPKPVDRTPTLAPTVAATPLPGLVLVLPEVALPDGLPGGTCPVCLGDVLLDSDNCPICGGTGEIGLDPGISLNLSAEGGLPSHILLFEVTGARNTAYLRTTATSVYDGETWRMDGDAAALNYSGGGLLELGSAYPYDVDDVFVTPMASFTQTIAIPVSMYPVSVSFDDPLRYYPEQSVFISTSGLLDAYCFRTVHYRYNESALLRAEVGLPRVQQLHRLGASLLDWNPRRTGFGTALLQQGKR